MIAALLALALQESWVNPPRQPLAGVEHRTFRSAVLNADVGYLVYHPPAPGPHPVVYYLHGMTDCESTHPELFGILQAAFANREVVPMTLVYVMAGRTSWYVDGEVKAETLLVRELIPHVEKGRPAGRRGAVGWSMGGFGALRLAAKHPSLFQAVVSLGGGFRTKEEVEARPGPWLRTQFGGDPERFQAESPWRWLRDNKEAVAERVPLALWVGDRDFLLENNRRMKAFLEELRIPATYSEIAGVGHEPKRVFAACGRDVFRFLSDKLR